MPAGKTSRPSGAGSRRTMRDFYYLNDDTAEIAGLRVYGAEWCSDFWGHPPVLFHDRIADFHLTPGWDTCAHLEEHQRITARLAKPGREGGRRNHPFPAHAGSH